MKRRLREAAEQARLSEAQARADAATRDRIVLRAHTSGGSLREIANEVGLSHVAVQKIVMRDRRTPS